LWIGASTTIGSYLLPAVVAEFWRQHPDIELLVQIENTQQVQRRLAAHQLDVGLTEGFVEEDELSAETFHKDELVVIASASHRFAAKRELPLSALRAEPFILREAGSGTRAVEETPLARRKLPVRTAMALGSTEAIKRVVAEGIGLAIVSWLAVRAECAAGTLAVLPVAGLRIEIPVLTATSNSNQLMALRWRWRTSRQRGSSFPRSRPAALRSASNSSVNVSRPRGAAMINLREACYAELPSAAQLPARRMCDDPMHCTVFATDADYRRVRLQYLFAGATAKAGPFMWRGRAGSRRNGLS
jgi:hypothetical protein